jgi:hypothetical protein
MSKASIHQLKVTLEHSAPPVWRRLEISSDTSLSDLGLILQRAMGWEEGGTGTFEINGASYGDGGRPLRSTLRDAGLGAHEEFEYLYSLGSRWEHAVTVEAVHPQSGAYAGPKCVAGEGACPTPMRYGAMQRVLNKKSNPDIEDTLEILPEEFALHGFDQERVNKRLSTLPLKAARA